MTFRVGQKVVCVDDADGPVGWQNYSALPVVGHIYTDRALTNYSDMAGVLLEEIVGKISPWGNEYSMRRSRFRPIVERKTDISALEALLLPNAKILEDA